MNKQTITQLEENNVSLHNQQLFNTCFINWLKEQDSHRKSRMTLQSRNRRLEKKVTDVYAALTRRNTQLNRMDGFIAKLYAEGRVTKDEIAILKQKCVKKNQCQG